MTAIVLFIELHCQTNHLPYQPSRPSISTRFGPFCNQNQPIWTNFTSSPTCPQYNNFRPPNQFATTIRPSIFLSIQTFRFPSLILHAFRLSGVFSKSMTQLQWRPRQQQSENGRASVSLSMGHRAFCSPNPTPQNPFVFLPIDYPYSSEYGDYKLIEVFATRAQTRSSV